MPFLVDESIVLLRLGESAVSRVRVVKDLPDRFADRLADYSAIATKRAYVFAPSVSLYDRGQTLCAALRSSLVAHRWIISQFAIGSHSY